MKWAKFLSLVILLETQKLKACGGEIFFFPFSFFLSRFDTFQYVHLTEASGIKFFFLLKFWVGDFYKSKEILGMRNYAIIYVMHHMLTSPHFIHIWPLAQLC